VRVLVFLLALLAACVRAPHAGDAAGPRVYLVVVDGLGARFATADRMPRLFAALRGEPERSSFFSLARAVMPARTNPNHVTLVTGVPADVHGITGNAFWSRTPGDRPAKLDAADRIEVETLFTVAAASEPRLRTLAAVAKPKLARLLGRSGRQRGPDVVWSPERLPAARRDPDTGYASDADTMRGALAEIAATEADLVVVNLSDVDRNGHAHGPESGEYAAAIAGADTAIGMLVDDLHARGRWDRAVVLVTADHGMTDVAGRVVSLGPALHAAAIDVTVVADGGIEHVYANGMDPDARDVPPGAAARALARAAALAARTDGVAEVDARLPGACAACPLLAVAHPDWHLDHERTGELVAVATPGWEFVDPFDPVDARLRGNHGGPEDRPVPLAVTGGWPGLRAAPPGAPSPDAVDVAPTIAAVLGLRRVRRLDGGAIPDDGAGRPIVAVLRDAPR
jgi:hypothetical protein